MTDQKTLHMWVRPKGDILNDCDSGIDYLGHTVYAEALAEKIDRVTPPLTIGVFGRWGSGKSFLLKYVKNLLDRRQRQHYVDTAQSTLCPSTSWQCRCCFRFLFFTISFSVIVISALWAAHPAIFLNALKLDEITSPLVDNATVMSQTTKEESSQHPSHFSRYIALSVLLFCLVAVGIVVCGNHNWWSSVFRRNFRLLLFVAFTKLPIKSHQKAIVKDLFDGSPAMKHNEAVDIESSDVNRRYIFVNFNAWEYAGSDTLWAGIVTKLSQEIEKEFGTVTPRLFRMLKVSAIPPDVKADERSPRLFIRFRNACKETNGENYVREIMMQFGVLRLCVPLCEWENRNVDDKLCSDFWVVEFSNTKEAEEANNNLSLIGIEVFRSEPYFRDSETHDDKKSLLKGQASLKSHSPRDKRVSCCCHFIRHPKTICRIPTLFWNLLAILAVISLPVITYTLVDILDLDIYRTGRAVPIVVQILSWLPAVGAASFVIIKFVWAMFHSQRVRIHSALAGAKSNMATQLGFMNKVKTEVQYITELLECAEFCHHQQYRVIISIDDLDRCALDKIKSVLEAVGILLSDNSSPFICLIAVDSRVAVKCIEETMGKSLLKSNVTGHEYLKKIINLPFCLPEIDNNSKTHLIGGLMEIADETTKSMNSSLLPGDLTSSRTSVDARSPSASNNRPVETRSVPDETSASDHIRYTTVDGSKATRVPQSDGVRISAGDILLRDDNKGKNIGGDAADGFPTRGKEVIEMKNIRAPMDEIDANPSEDCEELENNNDVTNVSLSASQLLFRCREFLYNDKMIKRHLEGNPRNIKRIFNVLSLTSWILHCHDKDMKRSLFLRKNSSSRKIKSSPLILSESLAKDLVVWVVLIDQWPYRMSYLLEIIEDNDERPCGENKPLIPENSSLFDIYQTRVLPEMTKIYEKEDEVRLLCLDIHPDMFTSFLQEIKDSNLLQNNIRLLQRFTISLDQSLRQTIVRQRDQFLSTSGEDKKKISVCSQGITGNS